MFSEKEPAKKDWEARPKEACNACQKRLVVWLFTCHVQGSGTKEGVAKYVFASLLLVVSDR
jgi:hypothetical protein